ncbi:hypothetical protein ACWC98_11390 [Streptomyces goshikiensis]
MSEPETATHVHLALHPDHGSAVTATITGSSPHTARATLAAHGFRRIDEQTMALARIDHDEPHYAEKAARILRDGGTTVEISAALQEEITTEWTYGNYPVPWLTQDEILRVSAEAQRIHDDIAAGRLIIHLHADDGWTTVAVGTYQGGKSVHLHGEDYLRQETMAFDTESEAVADFHRNYTVAVRLGPAPLTTIERAAAETLAGPPSDTGVHDAPARQRPDQAGLAQRPRVRR